MKSAPEPGHWKQASTWALITPFALLLVLNSWHHELWSDELHAWGLTVNSASLGELFRNLHYEGHPGLWHLLLWPISRLSHSPDGMQAVAFVIGLSIVILIGAASPFRLIERCLLLMNYFIVFEYTVMARNYGIGLGLALLYAIARRRWPVPDRKAAVVAGLLLGLMANTNVYALFLSGFLALEFAYAAILETEQAPIPCLLRALPGGLLYLLLLIFAVWTFYPPHDISHHAMPPSQAGPWLRFGLSALRTVVAPFVPIDFSFPESFAFPGNWFEGGKRVLVVLCLAPLVLAVLWTVTRHRIPLLLALAGTAVAVTIFPYLIYPAAIRHLGVMFIGFIVAFWLVRDRMPARPWPVLGLLAIGAIGGLTSLQGQWARPFAVNAQAANWIRTYGYTDWPIIGDDDMRTEPVGILLDRPFTSLDCMCEDRFVRFLDRRDSYTLSMAPDRLSHVARQFTPKPVLLLAEARFDTRSRDEIRARGLQLTELAFFQGAERDKQLALYKVEAAPR